jgi:hypothetical protein
LRTAAGEHAVCGGGEAEEHGVHHTVGPCAATLAAVRRFADRQLWYGDRALAD